MARQLAFDLPVRPALGRGDFFVSDANAHAIAMIDTTQTWPLGKLMLTGPSGAGKTHLAHVWASETGARFVVPGETLTTIEGPVVVDDADRWTLDAEEALFHLHNMATEARVPLLLTAREAPSSWKIGLPDLKSRMEAIPTAMITPPDDALLTAVLAKLFTDRQLNPSPALLTFVVPRIERSFAAARDFVERIDKLALAEGRAPSRNLAVRLLGEDGKA